MVVSSVGGAGVCVWKLGAGWVVVEAVVVAVVGNAGRGHVVGIRGVSRFGIETHSCITVFAQP